MALRRLLALAAVGAAVPLLAGCGSEEQATSTIPESARLAPADAIVYATITTDEDSAQWQKAESVLDRIPGARDGLARAIESALAEKGLTWDEDIAPALGAEVVVVATRELRPVALLQPESEEKLDALLAQSDEDVVRGEIEDWVAIAEKQADLDVYKAALERGTLEGDPKLEAGLEALPDESLGKVWVDVEAITDRLDEFQASLPENFELGVDWLSMALAADDEGMLFALGMRMPGGGDTRYEPELFERVPADAVAAISFGGTQGALDRLQGQADLGEISRTVEKATGVALEGIVDALSGEGVLYVRKGSAEVPEVTLALRPPDADKAWQTIDTLVRKLAEQANATVTTGTENGIEVSRLTVENVTLRYARLDAETIVVSTGADALGLLRGVGEKLVDSDAYLRAAEEVGLGERTKGFVYVDIDGLLPLVEGLAGSDNNPPDAREAVEAFDSLIFQAGGEGDTTRVRGFLRVND